MTALFSLLFLILGDGRAVLRITGHNPAPMDITVIHETIFGKAELYTLPGNGTLTLNVRDNEAILLLCRIDSGLVASAVLAVDTGQAEVIGAIAMPSAVSGVIFDQDEFGHASHGRQRDDLQAAEVLHEAEKAVTR